MKTFNQWLLENYDLKNNDFDSVYSLEDLDFKLPYDQLIEYFPEYQSDLKPSNNCGILFSAVIFYKYLRSDNSTINEPVDFKLGYKINDKGDIIKDVIIVYSQDNNVDINPNEIPVDVTEKLKTLVKQFVFDKFKNSNLE